MWNSGLDRLVPVDPRLSEAPPIPRWAGPPPRLIYGTGPWTDDNLSTALEVFFQSNAYHPQAGSVDPRRGMLGRGDDCKVRDSLNIPGRTDWSHSQQWSQNSIRKGLSDMLEGDLPSPFMLMEVGGPEGSHPPPVDNGHGIVDPPPLQQQDPVHRRIVHFCEGCLELRASQCETKGS